MRALEAIHSALRAGGALLDVRPAPEHPWIEVQREGRVQRLGQMDDSYRMGTLATSDAALQLLIDARRMVREREQTFSFVYHFDSIDAWLAYMAEHWSTACVGDELIGRAREALLNNTSGELHIIRSIHAARLRRIEPSAASG